MDDDTKVQVGRTPPCDAQVRDLLDRIAAELNGRPRQSLGFQKPSQVLAEAMR